MNTAKREVPAFLQKRQEQPPQQPSLQAFQFQLKQASPLSHQQVQQCSPYYQQQQYVGNAQAQPAPLGLRQFKVSSPQHNPVSGGSSTSITPKCAGSGSNTSDEEFKECLPPIEEARGGVGAAVTIDQQLTSNLVVGKKRVHFIAPLKAKPAQGVIAKKPSPSAGVSGVYTKAKCHLEEYDGGKSQTGFKDEQISIWTWNVNGINSVLSKNALQEFIDAQDPDILCFNEIKSDYEKIEHKGVNQAIPRKYHQYWNCCKRKKGYSGTGVLTKVAAINVQYDLGIQEHDDEGRSITLEFKHFVLVAVYVPNSGQNLQRLDYRVQQWDVDFRNHLCTLRDRLKKPVFLVGDLNVAHQPIDIYDPVKLKGSACYTDIERSSFQTLLNQGFVDTFRHMNPTKQEFTIWSNMNQSRSWNKGWRLDYMVVDKEHLHLVEDSTIHSEYYGSDHCPVRMRVNMKKHVVSKAQREEEKGEDIDDIDIDQEDLQRAMEDTVMEQ